LELVTHKKFKSGRLMPWGKGTVVIGAKGFVYLSGKTRGTMKRRKFIALAGATAAWPFAARAQQPAMPIIGFLGSQDSAAWAGYIAAFRKGLAEVGFEDGRNVVIEFRWAEGRVNRLPELAADLVLRKAAVIVPSAGSLLIRAARGASPGIPIVFVLGGDPVKLGFVSSLNRPDGNMTGVSFQLNVLVAKRIALLRELVPTATTIGLLVNPDNPNAESDTNDARAAANALGQQTHVEHVRTEQEFDKAFTNLAGHKVAAVFVASDPLFVGRRVRLVELAARHALPAIYDRREIATAGGLISYGSDFADAHRQAGIYAGRILKGEKPADLPIVQPTKFDLVINAKTAKALGLAVPDKLIALADEVIE